MKMRHIYKLMLLPVMALPLMLASCDEDRDSNPTLDLSHVGEEFHLNTPADAANNTYDLASASALTLTCSQPDYGGVPYAVRYYVQTSLDNNFIDSTKFEELTTSYTNAAMSVDASELNFAVCNLYQQGNTDLKIPDELKVYIRLRAIIDGTDSLGQTYSNSILLPSVKATYMEQLATLPSQMYIQGPAINGGAAKVVPPAYGVKSVVFNSYYTMVYMPAGGTLTWGPTATDFRGFDRLSTVDDQASAGVSADADGNVTFANAGWYTLVFDDDISAGDDGRLTQSSFTMHVYASHAYIIGAAASAAGAESADFNWTDSDPSWELTAPEGSGEWVSPEFTHAGELRAYIKIPGLDWWRTEFTIYNGKCYWRLVDIPANWNDNVGADYSVTASAGQRLYVNFDTGDASVR